MTGWLLPAAVLADGGLVGRHLGAAVTKASPTAAMLMAGRAANSPGDTPGARASMAKKTRVTKGRSKVAGGRIGLRTGEALVEADEAWSAAEPEVVIGELDGPVGYAIANLLGDQTKGHSRVFAILNSDVQVRPATLMVSKVTVNQPKYTHILLGTVQAGVAHGVLDAVRAGDIPKKKVNDLGIIVSVWLDPSIVNVAYDPEVLFQTNRQATARAIGKAMRHEPTIDWLLANQQEVPHFFHQLAVDGQLE
jgi:5,6,7,8-tetrahydromethanopterin hydro-lyase